MVSEDGLSAISAPGIIQARYLHRDDGQHPVLVVLWEDGSITSCAFERDHDTAVSCCHTEVNPDRDSFDAWVNHLVQCGYTEVPIEAE